MACNGLFGNGENNLIAPPEESRVYTLKEADLRIFHQDAFSLYIDFQIIKDMARELIPKCMPRGHQALLIANKIVDLFYTTQNIQACLRIADAFLNEKDPSPIHTIASIGHCHIDTAWLWPYDETRRKLTRSWATQVYLMDQFPNYKFACSQAQQFAWLLEDHPDLFRRIQEKVKENKFIPVGGTWVEFDGNIPSGESFVRQFLYGQLFFFKHFGHFCEVFWLPDTFGYSAQLPQIAKLSGIHYFFTQKLSWNNINTFPHTTFHWFGLDRRSSILTHFAPADTYCGQVTVKEMLMHLSNNKDLLAPISLDVFGNGDGGGGPTLAMVAKQHRLANVKGLPQMKPMDPLDFFKVMETTSTTTTPTTSTRTRPSSTHETFLASWYGELYFELHRGTYTSQAWTKKWNRQCEALLHDIEVVFSLLGMRGRDGGVETSLYPFQDIEKLWKSVLLNQFHDVLPGSSIGLVYQDAHKIYKNVIERGTELLQRGLASFSKLTSSTTSSSLWSAFNTCSFQRQLLVEIPVASNLAFAQLNAQGTHGYVFIEAFPLSWSPVNVVKPHVPVSVTQYPDRILLENEFMQYLFNVRGEILLIYDKRNQFSSSCQHQLGNVFEMYSDVPLFWDAWDVEVYHLNAKHSPYQPSEAKLSVLSTGPLCAELCLEMKLSATSTLRQTIRLDSFSPMLIFDTQVAWNEAHTLLKVAFPFDLLADSATYETAFGLVKRPTHMNTSWDTARFEVCGHRFADLSEHQYGVSLINDSKYGYSCIRNTLRMSLLRSPKSPDREVLCGIYIFKNDSNAFMY
ncbi:Alpha-mannosidase 2C1 [Coelomomyces lativittatus]|nr:Alpha-mannosidase 2C1 [Coelomomyces lativittatus]